MLHFFSHVFFFLRKMLGMDLPAQIVVACLIFEINYGTFYSGCVISYPHQQHISDSASL